MKTDNRIRCYRTACVNNTFHKSNCGFCTFPSVAITSEGCMDYREKECLHLKLCIEDWKSDDYNIKCPDCQKLIFFEEIKERKYHE